MHSEGDSAPPNPQSPRPPEPKPQKLFARLTGGAFWPTAPTAAELPLPAANALRRYPQLQDLLVRPRIGRVYRITAVVLFALYCLTGLGFLAYAAYAGEFDNANTLDIAEGMLGAGFMSLIVLVGLLLGGWLADLLRMTGRFLWTVCAACGIYAVVIALLCFAAGWALDGADSWYISDEAELGWLCLLILLGVAGEMIAGYLSVELLYRIAAVIADSQRWYWIRKAGAYREIDVQPPIDQFEVQRSLREHPSLMAWFFPPAMRRHFTYRILSLPMAVLLLAWIGFYIYAWIDGEPFAPLFVTAACGYVYFLMWLCLAPCGILLDLLKTPTRYLLRGNILWVGITVVLGAITLVVYVTFAPDEDFFGVMLLLAIVLYPAIYASLIVWMGVRAVRAHFRRQQLQSDLLEDAIDPNTYPAPPWQLATVAETDHADYQRQALDVDGPGQGSVIENPADLPLPTATDTAPEPDTPSDPAASER